MMGLAQNRLCVSPDFRQHPHLGLLLIAQSAGMLAKSASRAGYRPYVIDFYADSDTSHYSKRCIDLLPGPTGFDESRLFSAVERVALPSKSLALIYGSGIDTHPDLVEKLARKHRLLGNSPATLRQINNSRTFFGVLDQLGIPYPETRFTVPDRLNGWLIKPGCSEGGKGVVFCSKNQPADNNAYFQRHAQGGAYSLLFLANGKESRIVGLNRQFTTESNPAKPFLFAGAVNRVGLSEAQRSAVAGYAAKLTGATGLVGLNSMDFVLSAGACLVLEVNPRPSATMALYDEDFADGLLALHIAACLGELPPLIQGDGPVRILRIVYSRSEAKIPDGFHWPKGCMDIPRPGVKIEAGQPLCSLLVQGENKQMAGKLIKSLENEILTRITMTQPVSVNAHALPIVKHLIANADKLRLKIGRLANGATLIDAGIETLGSLEAGRLIGEICMGGLGTVILTQGGPFSGWPTMVHVHSTNPVISCLGSQYAGWSLSHGEGKGSFFALGSGPARALAVKVKEGEEVPVEEIFKELHYHDVSAETVIVLEVDKLPPVELIDKVAKACKLPASQVNVILTPTSSLAGGMQVVSRVLEVALHKAHALHFPLDNIIDGVASAPVPPPHPKFVEAMGRTNDAILFGGSVHLFVKGEDQAAEKLALELPSSVSKDYGKPFAQIFKDYNYDFFKIDAMLFSPAKVIVTNMDTGNIFHAGRLDEELLELSFGG